MMNTETEKLYNENDIKIHEDGILVKNTFFSRKKIADMFNELILMNNFINKQCSDK